MCKVIFKGQVIEEKRGKITINGHEVETRYCQLRTLFMGCIIGWLIILVIFIEV